ncbi:hypothetical protein BS50DRAFT_133894 [Corynespora cassiicola Philippines]|uniref:Metal tolerance protein 3 n=1 Tax=Corynespora cassiicola Philippines TaxID=1448308 RepID=A0A2T2N958_CORCC|nr:hypothetical protein BS50DRAFT_133894 [Corynespora cassiicola Philippines]
MYTSPITLAVFLISLFNIALASSEIPVAKLIPRQDAGAADPACLDYERIANLSTIGANSSYRSAYLARSSFGGLVDQKMFAENMAKLPALTADAGLNTRCGNKTEIALAGAESNLTQGIVGPFTEVTPGTIKNGIEVIVIVVTIMFIFCSVWVLSP